LQCKTGVLANAAERIPLEPEADNTDAGSWFALTINR